MKNDCVFCAIAAGEIPSYKIHEDDFSLAFLDVNPFSRGHVLVIPKAHAATIADISDGDLAELVSRVKKTAVHVKEKLGADGFNILQNNGSAAGQTVNHIHFHIVPRMSGEALEFVNRPGDADELKALAGKLKM